MIQYLILILVSVLVIDRFAHFDFKRIVEFFKFKKRFSDWVWRKAPRASNEEWREFRNKALELLSDDEKKALAFDEPLWKMEEKWTEEEIKGKKESDLAFDKLRKEERNFYNLWLRKQKPIIYYLMKLKLI